MPKVGDKDFPYTDEGIKQAASESAVSGIPVSNAGERNVTTYAGGGKTGYNVPEPNIIGYDPVRWMDDSPDFMEEGGKVKGEQQKPAKRKTIKHKFSDGSWYEGPDTPEARKRIKEEEFYQKEVKPGEDKIKAEKDKKKKDKEKADADAKLKAKKAKDDKKRAAARKIAAKEGLKPIGVMPGGSGRE